MVVIVIINAINCYSLFPLYVYQFNNLQGIANSILEGEGSRKEASKETVQGMLGSIPSNLNQARSEVCLQ